MQKPVRIYQPGSYDVGQTITLSEAASRHVALVLRKTTGEALELFCGDNHQYLSIITQIEKKRVTVIVETKKEVNLESSCSIHLAQAISKGERMEWVIQKAVELGVSTITPILSERSVVRMDAERYTKKQTQWQAIAISACEQTGRNVVPEIKPVLSFTDFLSQQTTDVRLILHPEAQQSWRDYDWFGCQNFALLIGPEGGFSALEIQHALNAGFTPLKLGPRILRTETAAITALSILQAVYGDL